MKREYEIRNHGTRVRPQWSINQTSGGRYLAQEAFWFKTWREAVRRLAEIIIEDAAGSLPPAPGRFYPRESVFIGLAYGEPPRDRAGHLVTDSHSMPTGYDALAQASDAARG